LVERLKSLLQERQWPALLQFAEDTAFQSIFWLDLQHASAQALEAMGEGFARAAATVGRETAAFLARLAGVERLAFAEGMPFADENALAWLQSLAGSAEAPPAGDLEEAIRRDIERIKPLVKSRKFSEAARAFQDRLKSAASAREQFFCRLEFADMLSKIGGAGWFAPQAERILEDIDAYRLDQFDPALALKGITLALKGYRAQSDAVSKKRTEELLQRLAQIDLTEFVRQGGARAT
jgi:type VI secretion system protein VasJ